MAILKRYLLVMAVMSVVVSSCVSCAGYMRSAVRSQTSIEAAGQATYQVTGTAILNYSKEFEAGKASVPFVTMQRFGTGYVADRVYGDISLVITAGHVCQALTKVKEHDVILTSYSLESNTGRKHPALIVADDDDSDVCVLAARGNLGAPLKLAESDPEVGSTVYYVGAPGGLWMAGGVVQVFGGLYGGHALVDGIDYSFVSLWAEGGASGSPIFVPGLGVIGLLTNNSHARDGGGEMTNGVSHREISKVLEIAREKARDLVTHTK